VRFVGNRQRHLGTSARGTSISGVRLGVFGQTKSHFPHIFHFAAPPFALRTRCPGCAALLALRCLSLSFSLSISRSKSIPTRVHLPEHHYACYWLTKYVVLMISIQYSVPARYAGLKMSSRMMAGYYFVMILARGRAIGLSGYPACLLLACNHDKFL
jgi:hypothetical protein